MSAESASPPTEHPEGAAADERRPARGGPWPDPDGHERLLERLIGVRSAKPSFYAAWREKSARLDRTIETLERISAALCATPGGPGALCEAVVEAAGHHFGARWAAMTFADGPLAHELPGVIVHSKGRVARGWDDAPPILPALASRAVAARRAVVAGADDEPGPEVAGEAGGGAVAVPVLLRDELAGALAVGLPEDAEVEDSDLSVLVTLANHAGTALHNAWTFQESERLRVRWEAASRTAERHAEELERRSRELERTRDRLEEAGRRQLLSQERSRIARELHDSVAQYLLSIGMSLEWCRRHESPSSPVYERVSAAKELARSAVDEIRTVIFELASDGGIDLRRALGELVKDVEAGTGLRVGLRTYGAERPLGAVAQAALVQIAREALFNVVRHANAERAWLTLRLQADGVRLAVADDGCGDAGELQRRLLRARPSGHHLGLANIGQRVRALHGSASFGRRRGGGVKLTVEVPLGGTGGATP
jgi:signal transduction histidine kinase